MRRDKTDRKTFEIDIYASQNRAFHKGAAAIGLCYAEHRHEWLAMFGNFCSRTVSGWSQLTLEERDSVLRYLNRNGAGINVPPVPPKKAGWNPKDVRNGFLKWRAVEPSEEKLPAMSKLSVLLFKNDKTWEYADGIAKKMFGISYVDFCTPEQLQKIIAAIEIAAKRKGKRHAEEKKKEGCVGGD